MALPKSVTSRGYNASRVANTNRFNRLVGNRIGQPRRQQASYKTRAKRATNISNKGRRKRATSVALGTSKLPRKVEKSRALWFGELGSPKTGVTYESSLGKQLKGTYDDLTAQLTKYENQAQQVQEEYVAQNTGIESADPIERYNAAHPGENLKLATPFTETWAGSPVGRALDLWNRPFYAVTEGMRNVIEEGSKEGFGWNTFTDATSGAYEGISGKRKTGAGEIYETFKNDSDIFAADWLRRLEEHAPWAEEQLSRGAGFAGEMYLDPTNYVMPGRGTISRFNNRVVNPTTFADDMVDIARHSAIENFDDIIHTRYGNQQWLPDREAFATHAEVDMLDRVTAAELNIMGGGRRGNYQVMNHPAWAQTASEGVVEGQRTLLFQSFNNHLQTFNNFITSGKPMSEAAAAAYIRADPHFARMIDDLTTELVDRGRVPVGSPLNVVLNAVGKQDKTRITRIADNIKNELNADFNKMRNDVYSLARNPSYRTLGVRVGKKFVPVRATGRAYNAVAEKLRDWTNKVDTDEISERSFEKMFPASLSLLAQKKRAIGADAFNEFKAKVDDIARQYSKEQAEVIHRSIEQGLDISGDPHLQAGKDFIMQEYQRMFQEEVSYGVRPDADSKSLGKHFLEDYVYVYLKKGGKKEVKKWKTDRKAAVHSAQGKGRGRFTTENAIHEGLNPVTDGFEALMYRNLKSQRDITRALFRGDLIENYGFWANTLDSVAMDNRKITRMDQDLLPQHLRQELKKNGGNYYLPFYHADLSKKFDELMSWNAAEMGEFMRNWNKVIGTLKASMTLPAPGFHINNILGDVFLGLFDGVAARDYAEIMSKGSLAAMGKAPTFTIGGQKYDFATVWSWYKEDASGGYMNIEHGGRVSPSTGAQVKRGVRKVGDVVIKGSEFRENVGRFTHYVHALKEEMALRAKSGMTDNAKKTVLESARDAALWRVNYYKFDYNALTIWERKLKTIGIPFYTYTRKVIPVLLASMFENPKYINMTSRFFEYHDGSSADSFNNWNVPGYLRMGGAAFLTDEAEPWTASMGGLPLGKLNMLQGGEAGTLNPADPNFIHGFAKTALEQANPIMQALIEPAMNKVIYDQSIINEGGMNEYLLNKIPMMKDILSEGNEVPGLRNLIPGEDKTWDPMSMIYNRLTGAGIQARPLSRGQQAQAQKDWVDKMIEDPLFQTNNSQDIFQIVPVNEAVPGGGMAFEVRSNLALDASGNASPVRTFNTALEAIQWVKSNVPEGYEKDQPFLEWGPNGQAQYVDKERFLIPPRP